jgi:regulator of sirC expression with transglutaminase-like and TPR domain
MDLPDRRERFRAAVERPDDEIDLPYVALLIAEAAYPGLDIRYYLRELARLSAEAPRIDLSAPPRQQIAVLSRYYTVDLGFRGNTEAYDDPRNSYLNDVLDRRTGIPITLTLVYNEIGRRLGLPLAGIGLPGHFLSGYVPTGARTPVLLIDVFNGGVILDDRGVAALLERAFGRPVAVEPQFLQPVGARAILYRMLNNLKRIYVQAGDLHRALEIVEQMVIVQPNSLRDVRDRGVLRGRLGHYAEALADLRLYAEQVQDEEERAAAQREIAWVRQMMARLS